MWKVGGIRIEHKQARSFFLRTDNEISEKQNFFTLWPVTRKGREILGWAIKGQMIIMYRGPNIYLAKSGCGAVLTLFWSPEVG